MTQFIESEWLVPIAKACSSCGKFETCEPCKPVDECAHHRTVFDRTICAEPCGHMHTYCLDCKEVLERCWWDEH